MASPGAVVPAGGRGSAPKPPRNVMGSKGHRPWWVQGNALVWGPGATPPWIIPKVHRCYSGLQRNTGRRAARVSSRRRRGVRRGAAWNHATSPALARSASPLMVVMN